MVGTSTSPPLSKVDRLRSDAAQAAQVRALTTHPDVIALRVERIRSQVDALIWAGMLLGLAFTMVNVQEFAAKGAVVFSLAWIAAWLLDPMVSLVLIAVLRAEQVTARYQVETGVWVRRTKVFAFAATYTMNTWKAWAALDVSGIVLHSVPPVLVYMAAEVGPILRDRLTEAVLRAAEMAATNRPATPQTASVTRPAPDVHEPQDTPVHEPAVMVVHEPARPTRTNSSKPRSRKAPVKRRRVLYGEYLDMARTKLTPGVTPTPKWVQEVTGCSAGTSVRVARDLRAELPIAQPAANPVVMERAA
jgi:hypothetical protein